MSNYSIDLSAPAISILSILRRMMAFTIMANTKVMTIETAKLKKADVRLEIHHIDLYRIHDKGVQRNAETKAEHRSGSRKNKIFTENVVCRLIWVKAQHLERSYLAYALGYVDISEVI